MCIAVPMKVTSVDEQTHTGQVLLSGSEMSVDMRLVSPKVGDYVLVHAGCAIEILKPGESEELERLHREIRDLAI